jgi:transposase
VDRAASLIQRLTGVQHHLAHVWALLHHRLGRTVQRPVCRAAERDQAAIDFNWKKASMLDQRCDGAGRG